MKSIFMLIIEQFRSGEIWKRVWQLNRFRTFRSLADWKQTMECPVKKEDIPAIILSLMLASGLIAVLSSFLQGADLSLALTGSLAFIYMIQNVVEAILKRRKHSNS